MASTSDEGHWADEHDYQYDQENPSRDVSRRPHPADVSHGGTQDLPRVQRRPIQIQINWKLTKNVTWNEHDY